MKKMILVAHGNGGEGTFSIPKVKTITPAGKSLSFADAIKYMNSSNPYPEYSSTSFYEFGKLSDLDCKALFSKVPSGKGIVPTGKCRGNDPTLPIFCLRGEDITVVQLEAYINKHQYTSVVLLACRS
ncbi:MULTISPECIES: hypothetical protein [unclassified Vibrio]|uniref:hypothetical protein n=1 Tax=unclassified Vibrio TaxID=2614977 RepID=UPI0012689689|nr:MULTISPECIES: hypothetical protein [unclassified Vibrio]QFT39748.1 hypothetical protein FIU99_25515 [Vibrio sp. THAF64]QGM37745.1 hypothetical protein GGC04_25965 [Vibrio sp. THAF191d]QGN73088.1 hypothetical protein GGC03_25190 [Vibrio sp. THAF191c]